MFLQTKNTQDTQNGGTIMIKIDVRKTTKWGNDMALFVSFPFNTELVNFIKALPCRVWHIDEKEWEVPFNKFEELLTKFKEYDTIEITAEDSDIFQDKEEQLDFDFKTTPFKHQIDGFKYGLTHKRWLLGDEQGLGKTKQVIDIAVASKAIYGYKHCLIVCGVNGLKWNWVNEIATHSNEKAWILGQTIKNHKTVIDSNAKKYNDLLDLRNGVDVPIKDSYFLVTNVESLRDENIVSILSELCKDGTIGLIAADECHKMKNAQSQQGKGFLKLQADTMIAMTGTPLMNSPLDLYIILKWLGYESHSFYSFKNHYCVMGGYGNYQVIGYKHLENLQAQLNDFMLRRLKKDVLDLPEKTFIDEYVEMTPKQTQIYKEVYNNIIANIDKVAKAVNPLAEMIRLRQATGYTGILSSTIAESAKLDRMEELVDDAVENGKKVVIFSNWTQMTDVIFDRLSKKYNGCLITGETKDEARQNLVNLFQDGQFDFIVGTIGAIGTGLTLTEGSVEIFIDEPWNMALKDQAVDRCHRIGQQNNITIYTLLTKNTIDERIHELVTKKGAMSDAIVDGKISGDKRALIDYLLA